LVSSKEHFIVGMKGEPTKFKVVVEAQKSEDGKWNKQGKAYPSESGREGNDLFHNVKINRLKVKYILH
jgi:hypothetical protein